MSLQKRRVVVTGTGILSPIGHGPAACWQSLLQGQSGIDTIKSFDASEFPVQIAGECAWFELEKYLTPLAAKHLDKFSIYAIVAAEDAIVDSGIDLTKVDLHRFGVAVGSGIGGIATSTINSQKLLQGPRKVSPFFVPASIINIAAGHIAMRFGCQGPNFAVVTACTTGAHNIGHAARTIQYGDADCMLAGGSEMAVTELGIAGFAAMKALSKRNDDPTAASRPWDRDRDGFVLGAGAGVLLLEEYNHAKARGANILAELTGFAASGDAHHMTLPEPSGDGAYRSMQQALHDANLTADQLGYINAHATSTKSGDAIELLAIERLFQGATPAVSASKSMTGHLLGAAGAVEAIFTLMALKHQVAPPTINLEHPPSTNLNLVPNTAQDHKIQHAMSNSFGFGGTNSSLVFSSL